jgi:hypothetical protein
VPNLRHGKENHMRPSIMQRPAAEADDTPRAGQVGRADPFHRFGVVRDDYSPKPAFERLRRTFAELR